MLSTIELRTSGRRCFLIRRRWSAAALLLDVACPSIWEWQGGTGGGAQPSGLVKQKSMKLSHSPEDFTMWEKLGFAVRWPCFYSIRPRVQVVL